MNEIHIIGAGGLASDFCACFRTEVSIAGFWDDRIVDGISVLGTIDDFLLLKKPVSYVIITGSPVIRKAISVRTHRTSHHFPVLIHSLSRIFDPGNVSIGNGIVIFPGVFITTKVQIGMNTIIHIGCFIHHDVIIGDNNVLMPRVRMTGNTCTGNEVYACPNSVLTTGQKIMDGERKER